MSRCGAVVGYVGGWALARWGDGVSTASRNVGALSLSLIAYAGAVEIGANGFVAAFIAGLAYGTAERRRDQHPFAETLDLTHQGAELLSLTVWFLFGAVMMPQLTDATWRDVVFALLALTVLRMVPVWLSLIGVDFDRSTIGVIGWFGPRGLASVVFALMAVGELPAIDGNQVLVTITMTVTMSVILHGATAAPIAARYGSRHAVGVDQGTATPEIDGSRYMSRDTSTARQRPNALVRSVPIVGWLPQYEKSWLAPDLLAGLSVWALVVPQALGYAAVVGVPAQYGLYTILGASVLYAVFASTHQVVTGPSASVAAVTAPVAALYVASTSPDYLSTVIALTLCVGVVYVLLGVFRMGWISNFLAKAVLEGFIFAVGFGLLVDQLPKILGIPKTHGSYWDVLVGVVKDLDLTNRATLVVGAAAVGLLLLMRFKAPRLPRSFVVVLLGILVVSVFDLTEHGVEVVGDVPTGLPSLALPTGFSVSEWLSMAGAHWRSSSSATASRSPPPRTPRRGTTRNSRRTRSSSPKARPGSVHHWWAGSPDAAA